MDYCVSFNVFNVLPRQSFVKVYKAFIRPHLDNGDFMYNRSCNESFHQKIDSIQYNASITDIVKGTSGEKLCHKLGLESFCKRQWYKKLNHIFKYLKISLGSIFSKYFEVLAKHIIQELKITISAKHIFLEILFSTNCL